MSRGRSASPAPSAAGTRVDRKGKKGGGKGKKGKNKGASVALDVANAISFGEMPTGFSDSGLPWDEVDAS